MPIEVFYYRTDGHNSQVQDFLSALDHKALARTLSQIDLLEGEDLPEEIDSRVPDMPLSVLSVRSGRGRLRFIHVRKGDHVILIDASEGKTTKLRRSLADSLSPIITAIEAHGESAPIDHLKSHREFVAEATLSDPTIAAAYSRAREHAQFALSVIKLRINAGFSQATLAERTGLTEARIASLERGRLPKIATMRRLVDALQARVTISPGTGIRIEPFTETKRNLRPRKSSAPLPSPTDLS